MNTQLFIPIQRSTEFELELVDFSVVVQPVSAAFLTGTVARYNVTFVPVGSFNSPLYLEVTNLPQGAVAQFSVNPADVSDTVELTIDTANVPPGEYNLQVVAVPGI